MTASIKLFLILFIIVTSIITGRKTNNEQFGLEIVALVISWIGILWAVLILMNVDLSL